VRIDRNREDIWKYGRNRTKIKVFGLEKPVRKQEELNEWKEIVDKWGENN